MSRASPFTTGNYCALGCRGFTGPIPPPLWMSVIQLCSKRDKLISAVLAPEAALAGGRVSAVWPSCSSYMRMIVVDSGLVVD